MSFDTEKFIKEVQARPCLWNNQCPEFENKNLKYRTWKELCDIFIPNFLALDSAAKNKEVIGLQRRWKTLRDSFNRELKARRLDVKNTADSESKTCPYFEQLSFLRPILEAKMRDTPGSPSGEQEQGVSDQAVPNKRKRSFSHVLHDSSSPNSAEEVNGPTVNDSDLQFFRSMIPYVRMLSPKSKLNLRMVFISLIQKYSKKKISPPIVNELEGSSRTTPAVYNGTPKKGRKDKEEEVDLDALDLSSDTSPGLSAGYTDESVSTED